VLFFSCASDRYLLENMDWLEEELGSYDDDYLIIDCPGIILLCGMKSDTVFLMSAFLFFSFFFFFFCIGHFGLFLLFSFFILRNYILTCLHPLLFHHFPI